MRSDLWLVQAYIALKLHRFADAQRLMEVEPERATCPQGLLIQSELDVQQGRYQAARETIRQSLDSQLTWEGLARLAYLTGLLGDVDTADKLYHCAQQELTVKQMHAYAWVEVQRGVRAFQGEAWSGIGSLRESRQSVLRLLVDCGARRGSQRCSGMLRWGYRRVSAAVCNLTETGVGPCSRRPLLFIRGDFHCAYLEDQGAGSISTVGIVRRSALLPLSCRFSFRAA